MHYLALYRKYRPSNFDEVVGQDKVIKVIKNEIINNRISHAYMFSGPRGTGKTTTAKIIAKLVNCDSLVDGEACNQCESCLNFKNSNDIVEIDAASNNGVDEIRELRDKVNLVPSNSKYKVYIIDEVHMLTTQAFNALLKTLEEPPSHAIFILATTEPHKIPLTVASRCQKFQFSKISNNEIVKRLKNIVEQENIQISDDILFEIGRLSDGGLRDAINMLDQLIAYKNENIVLEDVYNINGCVSYVDLYNFIINILNNNVVDIVSFIEETANSGKNISKFIEEIIIFLKDILLKKNANIECDISEKQEKIVDLSIKLNDSSIYNMIYTYNDVLNNIKISTNPVILFVISTMKIIKDNNFGIKNEKDIIYDHNNKSENNVSSELTNKEIVETENFINKKEKKSDIISLEIVNTRINNTFVYANKNDLSIIKSEWNKISDYLFDSDYSIICGILKDTEVIAAGSEYLILVSKFDSVVDKINSKLDEFENALYNIFKKKYYIVALSDNRWNDEKNKYIINIKNGYKYNFIEEKVKEESKKEKTPVDELIDIIGEDLIEMK